MDSSFWPSRCILGWVSAGTHYPLMELTDNIAGVVKGYRMRYGWLVVLIIAIWCFAVLLTVLGPAMHGNHFFTRAGGWVSLSSLQCIRKSLANDLNDSAGYPSTTSPSDCGCTICGYSLSNSVPWLSTVTFSSTLGDGSAALSTTIRASFLVLQSSW